MKMRANRGKKTKGKVKAPKKTKTWKEWNDKTRIENKILVFGACWKKFQFHTDSFGEKSNFGFSFELIDEISSLYLVS